jgi:hypothetical protein
MPSGERLILELDPAGGAALRVEWDVDALRDREATSHEAGTGDVTPAWRVEPEPDWERSSALRLISATFDDGALLAVAALRPRGAAGHDADAVGAILVSPEGEVTRPREALLSTEYGPDGMARRLGLELYEDSAAPPVRVVADRVAGASEGEGGGRTALALRMEGTPGAGLYEQINAR